MRATPRGLVRVGMLATELRAVWGADEIADIGSASVGSREEATGFGVERIDMNSGGSWSSVFARSKGTSTEPIQDGERPDAAGVGVAGGEGGRGVRRGGAPSFWRRASPAARRSTELSSSRFSAM